MFNFFFIIWKVEHGSAAFIQTANNKTVMFDAGSSDEFSPSTWLVDNFNLSSQSNRLDKIIISHPDRDHITDLPYVKTLIYPRILSRNKAIPENVIYPDGTSDLNEPLLTFKKMNDEYNHTINVDDYIEPIANWGNVLIKTFNCNKEDLGDCPENKLKNNLSLLSYIRYEDLEIIFPGDLEPLGWEALLNKTDADQYLGKAQIRILVAPHHGRKSGIRYFNGQDEVIYERFLETIKPHLVIMSDKRGTETTDIDAYNPYCLGALVYNNKTRKNEVKKVLTTKTNEAVTVTVTSQGVFITAY